MEGAWSGHSICRERYQRRMKLRTKFMSIDSHDFAWIAEFIESIEEISRDIVGDGVVPFVVIADC